MLEWAKAAGFAAIFAVALAGSLHFALYYPPPSYLISSGKPQTHSAESAQTGVNEPRGTPDAPVVVKILPPEPGTPEAAERKREQDEKAASDRGLLWFTAVLSIATIALMFATVGLVFSSKRQIEDSRLIQRAHVFVLSPKSELRVIATATSLG